jgi:hypothetical protein
MKLFVDTGNIKEIEALGIPIREVTEKLLVEGIASFQKSFDTLIIGLQNKTKALGKELAESR